MFKILPNICPRFKSKLTGKSHNEMILHIKFQVKHTVIINREILVVINLDLSVSVSYVVRSNSQIQMFLCEKEKDCFRKYKEWLTSYPIKATSQISN